MDFQNYARKNLFSYNVDIPSVNYLKQYLEERGYPLQVKDLVVIIPDKDENPKALHSTIIQLALSNLLTGISHNIDRDRFRIKRIIVSDQSNPVIAMDNRGLLYTVKDVLSDIMKEDYIPEIYHLHFDTKMSKIVYGHLRDYLKLSRKESRKPILGKGINMALSSLVSSDFTEDGVSDKDTVLVYMDAENNTVDSNDPFLLGAPLIYEDSPKKFIKAAFKRYHMDGDRRKLGGRVNASLGVPLIHMLIHEGLMQIGKPITYPLSGEIGIDRDLFWSLKTSKKYGVETATLLQLFGKESENRITEEDFSQVDLGINMDQPLAEGDPPDEVLKKVKRMSDDILSTTLQIMGGQIRKTWKYKDFMDMFEDFQRKSIERWIESHDNNVITGGINHEDLRETVFDAVSQRIDRHYHGDSPFRTRLQKIRNLLYRDDTDGFVPSIMEIKKELGGKFDEFRIKLKDHSKRIYPEE